MTNSLRFYLNFFPLVVNVNVNINRKSWVVSAN